MADADAAGNFIDIAGQKCGDFKKCQYLGHVELKLMGPKDARAKMAEIHRVANQAMKDVHKDHKHRHLGFSKCFVTTEGIYLYESDEKVNVKPTCSWQRAAREIYCVVMGARALFSKNQHACIMRFITGPDGKPHRAKDGSLPVDCCVIEFHHDRKNRAAQFHRACEEMMKALLFSEMAKIEGDDKAAAEVAAAAEDGTAIAGGYMDVPMPEGEGGAPAGADGYMDVPEPNMDVGKKARRRISSCIEGGGDYLQVVVAHDGNRSLSDSLAELDDDDDEDPADLSDDE